MRPWNSLFFLILKLFVLALFLFPFLASALDEIPELYSAPQGLAMGNAFTADASGYAANYYNPAGLAKVSKKNWEVVPVALEVMPSLNGLGHNLAVRSGALSQISRRMAEDAGDYYYHRLNFVPAFSFRRLGVALLMSQQIMGRSDGVDFDLNFTNDVVPTVGTAFSLADNILKLGVSGKAVFRQQLKGKINHTQLASAQSIESQMKEGVALGLDVGMLLTLPTKYLPTLGVVWKDATTTKFMGPSQIFQNQGNGLPDSIEPTINAAFSLHPYFSRDVKSTVAFEVKHLQRSDLALRKRIHLGVQIDTGRTFYVWGGLNQMYWTLGMGLRVSGGNFELGSYGVEIGNGAMTEENRRFFLRYTLGF